jgi:hypothetical protein
MTEAENQALLNDYIRDVINKSGGSNTVPTPAAVEGSLAIDRVYTGKSVTKTKGVSRMFPKGITYTEQETVSTSDKINEYYDWTPQQYNAFVSKLKKLNYISDTASITEPQVQALWVSAVTGTSRFYNTTNGKKKLTVDDYLTLYAPAKSKDNANLPTQTIQKFAPAVVDSLIDEFVQTGIGRKATEADYAVYRPIVNKMINTGSTTTEVEKGGKIVRTTTPTFSKEEAGAAITKKLETGVDTKLEAERRKAFEFNQVVNKVMSGGI